MNIDVQSAKKLLHAYVTVMPTEHREITLYDLEANSEVVKTEKVIDLHKYKGASCITETEENYYCFYPIDYKNLETYKEATLEKDGYEVLQSVLACFNPHLSEEYQDYYIGLELGEPGGLSFDDFICMDETETQTYLREHNMTEQAKKVKRYKK